MLVGDVFDLTCRKFQGGFPVRFHPVAVVFNHGHFKAIWAIKAFVRKTVTIRQPTLVDAVFCPWQHAHDFIVLNVHFYV